MVFEVIVAVPVAVLGWFLFSQAQAVPVQEARDPSPSIIRSPDERTRRPLKLPHPPPEGMHIGMIVVGTFGDVQPFLAIAIELQNQGHRVRLATHELYRKAVQDAGISFYPLYGDPKKLSEYMVETKGRIIPRKWRDLVRTQTMIAEVRQIMRSTWPAMTEAIDPAGNEVGAFRPDALISNPVAWGHVHVAEKLDIPLHLMFPQPWRATTMFPHSMVNAYGVNIEPGTTWNKWSYTWYDQLNWLGTNTIVNEFRAELKLPKLNYTRFIRKTHSIPCSFTYSRHLLPKPADWGEHLHVVGPIANSVAKDKPYTPSADLQEFLCHGKTPIYVGFGSMVIDNPERLQHQITEAAFRSNQRVILQSGWTEFHAGPEVSDQVFVLVEPVPHSWLFKQVAGVVHHGGAGTTTAGLLAGKPTLIIPFFGDQFLWGKAIEWIGAGLPPINLDALSVEKLAIAFDSLQSKEIQQKVAQVAEKMQLENGVEQALEKFYLHLPRWTTDPTSSRVVWLQ